MVTSQDKSISRSSAPKATQPSFTSKGTDADFAAFSEFLKKFEFFVSNVASDAQRLQWLQQCIKGDALHLIKNLSLDNDNYIVALDKLKARYLNKGPVKHSLLQSLLNFKCVANPKYTNVQN